MQVDRIMLLFYHTHVLHEVRDAGEDWHEIVEYYVSSMLDRKIVLGVQAPVRYGR